VKLVPGDTGKQETISALRGSPQGEKRDKTDKSPKPSLEQSRMVCDASCVLVLPVPHSSVYEPLLVWPFTFPTLCVFSLQCFTLHKESYES
jgi:hypothetical protein